MISLEKSRKYEEEGRFHVFEIQKSPSNLAYKLMIRVFTGLSES